LKRKILKIVGLHPKVPRAAAVKREASRKAVKKVGLDPKVLRGVDVNQHMNKFLLKAIIESSVS
jgi:hypothetical protein